MIILARFLRWAAQWLDPRPTTIELCRVSAPDPAMLNDLRGFPVYFWLVDDRTISFYPAPDFIPTILIRRV